MKINKTKISLSIDVAIIFFFILLALIFFVGGYTFKVGEVHLKARSLLKPSILLLALFAVKLMIANYSLESEKNKVLLYSTVVFIFIVGELGARVYNYYFEDKDIFWANRNLTNSVTAGISLDTKIEYRDLIRLSSNKRITYELVPNLKGIVPWDQDLDGYRVEINSHGLRDNQDFQKEKGSSEYRIIGLGDSEMFGWGVEFENTFGEVVERELNGRAKHGEIVRFLNMGVAGYNTTMSVETFLTKGVHFAPNFVVLAYHENDLNIPNFIIRKDSPFSLRRSFFVYYLTKKLSLLANYKSGIAHLRQTPNVASMYKRHLIPEDYRFMYGKQPFVRELKKLKQKCDALGIPLIVFINKMSYEPSPLFPDSVEFAIKTSEEMNIPVVEWRQEVKKFLQEKGENLRYLQVSHRDPHANKIGHSIKGKVLASYIYPHLFDSAGGAKKKKN